MAPQDSENCGQNFSKRKQSDAVFAGKRLLRMVIIDIYIVINTIVGRLTLDPAGMHCPAGDDAFVSSLFFCLLVTLRVRYLLTCCAFEGCIVRTSIALPFIARFL